MRIYLDSSAWIQFFIQESGTEALQQALARIAQKKDTQFLASAVTYAEMHAIFARAAKTRRINEAERQEMVKVFEVQWKSVELPETTSPLITLSGNLARVYALRGCDAFQLASALSLQTDWFVSCNEDLNQAAIQENLRVWNAIDGQFAK